MRVFTDIKQRREARRWQRWSEVDPEVELRRRARVLGWFAVTFLAGVIALVVIGLVVAR
jgi:hypothetical protein